MITLENRHVLCRFDSGGRLTELVRHGFRISFCGLDFDLGCDGEMLSGLLSYQSMLDFHTWDLPDIRPTGERFPHVPVEMTEIPGGLDVLYRMGSVEAVLEYRLQNGLVRVSMRLTNLSDRPVYLNTCAFLLRLPHDEAVFDFPGNVPVGHFRASDLQDLCPVQTGLVNFAVHLDLPDGGLNLLFIDETEKWGCGVYRDGKETCFVFDAGLEADLAPGRQLEVGNLYLLPCASATGDFPGDGDPYLQIRDTVSDLGFHAAEGGIHEGVMYSCHPSGTMDAGFPLEDDLFSYARVLPELRDMGVDHVWLLPVFDHNEQGVYHSNDQSVIDSRYGGEEGCRFFCEKAHELGMTVLFDYVPHGPAPEYPLVREHPDWPSKRRDGSLQDEWECVSMDYNNPDYLEYLSRLVCDHVHRFGVDGARIDCAMGGLSNWRPFGDNRPSGNSVLAGVHVTEAIRDGFLRGGKPSFILPENFNPLPNYYHCTDLFYGMNLYRAFVELESLLKTEPTAYVRNLTDFLRREALVTPASYCKLRFLGNHDTVSWVWQSARAVDCYGPEATKMLFALISLIDGVPMLYQGDEDPAVYGGSGEKFTDFFQKLFAHRKAFIPKGNVTHYLFTDTPVMAFIREPQDVPDSPFSTRGKQPALVLINLSPDRQPAPKESRPGTFLAASDDKTCAPDAPLSPYSYRILGLDDRRNQI